VFWCDVPAEDDVRRGERPASATEKTADAGRAGDREIDVERILDDVRAACRRIREAWRDARAGPPPRG
jgi:hypothetical protein